jgi:hypothetical protein
MMMMTMMIMNTLMHNKVSHNQRVLTKPVCGHKQEYLPCKHSNFIIIFSYTYLILLNIYFADPRGPAV